MLELALASAADEGHAPAATTALLSAAVQMQVRPACIFIDCGLQSATRSHVEEMFGRYGIPLTWLPADLAAYGDREHLGPPATYARLQLPAFAQGMADRTLYLDADTLTVSSIESLASLPLQDCAVGAVMDVGIPALASPRGGLNWRDLALPPATAYFNAGVLLIDNRRWTEAGISPRALEFIGDHGQRLIHRDQDALNAVIGGFWMPLDRKWNFQVSRSVTVRAGAGLVTRRLSVPVADLGILHFPGEVKPWHAGYPPGAVRRWYAANYARFAAFAEKPRYWPAPRWIAGQL